MFISAINRYQGNNIQIRKGNVFSAYFQQQWQLSAGDLHVPTVIRGKDGGRN
jgi:hypothetical protein